METYLPASLHLVFQAGFWQDQFLGNTVERWAIALAAFVGFIIVFKVFQSLAIRKLEKLADKTKTDIDDVFVAAIETIRPPFYSFLAFYFALNFVTLHDFAKKVIDFVFIVWITYQVIVAVQTVVNHAIKKRIEKHAEEERGSNALLEFIGKLINVLLWVFGLLLILSNLGVNVTSLVAGLGIGGIAIALALQNILGDLFSSFAIYFDKPFVVGDFIVVGTKKGTVEKIGIKTTRIRSAYGEEIVISNKELTSATIQNYKKMEERRGLFVFGVLYETPQEKLEKVPEMVQKIVESTDEVRFDRVHFKEFADSSLNFEVSYYVETNDYRAFMDAQQKILFAINKKFNVEGISMAYPTQTIYLQKD